MQNCKNTIFVHHISVSYIKRVFDVYKNNIIIVQKKFLVKHYYKYSLVSGVWTSTFILAVAVTLVVMWDVDVTGDIRLDPLVSDPLQFC